MHAIRNILRDARANFEADMLAFRLRRMVNSAAEQKKVLAQLLEGFSRSDFGRAHKLTPGMAYEQFRERVPPQSHAALAPLIDQVAEGVPDVLWPGTCSQFATLPTLPGETQRLLPVTVDLAEHFRKAWRRCLLQLCIRSAPLSTLRARQHWLGVSAHLQSLGEQSSGRVSGNMADILAASLYSVHAIACHQAGDLAVQRRFPHQTGADGDPSLLVIKDAGQLPAFLADYGPAFLSQPKRSVIQIDPLQVLSAEDLRTPTGATLLHEVFASEAGIIAAQDDDDDALGLRLFTGLDLFLEFIPHRDFDATRVADLSSRVIPVEQVQAGIEYVVLVSSPAGLCRYVTGELVRFVSTTPHRILRVGHTSCLLNAHGECVNARQISECLTSTCLRHHWSIVYFHVAPNITNSLTGSVRGHHEWWVELKPGTVETPTGATISDKLDKSLQSESPDYALRRKTGAIEAPVVRLVMPGVFEQWMQKNGLQKERFSIPQCLPHRRIADGLAKVARFYD